MLRFSLPIIFLLCFSNILFAQFTDDFSDGNFTSNPNWSNISNANTSGNDFEVVANKLNNNGPSATASLYISTPLQNANEWIFRFEIGVSTSSSNYARVYLMSNEADLTSNTLKGYYVELGRSNDDIDLVYQDGTSTTNIINGTGSPFSGASNVRIKVTRDASGSWTMTADLTGGTNFTTDYGSGTENSFASPTHFGVFVRHSSTRNQAFFFDDFQVIDNLKPTVSQVQTTTNANELKVIFSESVDLTTAQNTSNYSVNNSIGNPTSAIRDATKLNEVILTFSNNFSSGTGNTLTVQNVEDLNNNAMDLQNINFTYAPAPVFRDIVINEIFADEAPQVGLPEAEFVELYNTKNYPIEVTGWKLGGAGSGTADSDAFPSFTIPANGFVILTASANTGLFSGNVISLGSSTTFTNSGEELILKNASDVVMDRITYTTTMYQDENKTEGGWSLEQINPNLSCSSQTNWRASNNAQGGTPNAQNSIFNATPDQTAPSVLSLVSTSPNTLQVTFNETMDANNLNTVANYSLDEGISITTVVANADLTSVDLTLASNLNSGQIYNLTFANITDCSGNPLSTNSERVGLGETPNFNELIITEIFADESPQVGLPEAEFIEIYNTSNKIIDLENCTFSDNGSPQTFSKNLIFPQEYVVVCDDEDLALFQSFGKLITLSSFPSLTNSGETLTLRNSNTSIVFSITFSDDWYNNSAKKDGGYALEMIDVNNPCGEENNWTGSNDSRGGTPAQENSVNESRPDNIAPQVLRAFAVHPDTVEIFFNEKMDSTSLANGSYTIDNSISVESKFVQVPDFKTVLLKVTPPMQTGIVYTITAQNMQDCSGNLMTENNQARFGLAETADSSDIIINEVLFNPRTGGSDFVELYNKSSKYINLKNWEMANVEEEIVANREVITEENYVLSPQEYVVLTEDPTNIQTEYPKTILEKVLEINNLPTYADAEGTVVLLNDQAQTQDLFAYTEDYHTDLLDDDNGVSLERISFTNPTNDKNNWTSAGTRASYATPTLLNSQSRENINATGTITIEPKIITPDGDGDNDFATITYQFDNVGQIASIKIYDKQGRFIKDLAKSELLSAEGFYIWDGSTTEGSKAPLGYYVIFIEIFDANGNKQQFVENIAVGARF